METNRLRLADLEPCSRLHVWNSFLTNAWGFHSKRDDGVTSDVFWYLGDVRVCVFCATMMFDPYGAGLSSVPCVMVDPADGIEIQTFQIQAA